MSSKIIQEDYFYLCVSMIKQKIICVYGVKTFKNNINMTNNTLNIFIFFGKLITVTTILCLVVLIKKIKNNYFNFKETNILTNTVN